jgi:RNA polymerase sigma factor (sigma-70 family)
MPQKGNLLQHVHESRKIGIIKEVLMNKAITLLTDIPEKDLLFGFDKYASVLTSAIMGTEPHFTMGIFGGWGCGKTTLLRRMEAQLKAMYPDKALAISFDAWRYQSEEHMILPLLNTLANTLRKEQHWRGLGDNLKQFTKYLVAATRLKTPWFELAGDKALKQWQEDNDELTSLYYDWLNQLQAAVDATRKGDPQKRIVILIDDIDRCLPNKVVEVLESIKVMLDVSGLIFVLALDRQIVEKAIEGHYGDKYSIQGRDYLKKLIQVEFRLPPLRNEDIISYTNHLITGLGQKHETSTVLAEVSHSVIGGNPREVKRFINSVLLGMAIMKTAKIKVLPRLQVAFMAMDFRWPGVMRVTQGNPGLFNGLPGILYKNKEMELSENEAIIAKALLQDNPGLDAFLKTYPGRELFHLTSAELDQLLFFSSMTKESGKLEIIEDIIDDILATLTPREQRVIQMRFGFEDGRLWTLKEVSKEFGVTGATIRLWEARALRKLRHPSRSRPLRSLISSGQQLSAPYYNLMKSVFGELLT